MAEGFKDLGEDGALLAIVIDSNNCGDDENDEQ